LTAHAEMKNPFSSVQVRSGRAGEATGGTGGQITREPGISPDCGMNSSTRPGTWQRNVRLTWTRKSRKPVAPGIPWMTRSTAPYANRPASRAWPTRPTHRLT